MLKIQYVNGSIDGTLSLDPAQLTGDLNTDRASAYVRQFVGGKFVTVGNDGYARLATDTDLGSGPLILDAFGAELENVPALAGGKMAYAIGGAVAYTDQVVEDTIVAGDNLFLGGAGDEGMLTKVDPGSGIVVAKSRTDNSVADKTVLVQVL